MKNLSYKILFVLIAGSLLVACGNNGSTGLTGLDIDPRPIDGRLGDGNVNTQVTVISSDCSDPNNINLFCQQTVDRSELTNAGSLIGLWESDSYIHNVAAEGEAPALMQKQIRIRYEVDKITMAKKCSYNGKDYYTQTTALAQVSPTPGNNVDTINEITFDPNNQQQNATIIGAERFICRIRINHNVIDDFSYAFDDNDSREFLFNYGISDGAIEMEIPVDPNSNGQLIKIQD